MAGPIKLKFGALTKNQRPRHVSTPLARVMPTQPKIRRLGGVFIVTREVYRNIRDHRRMGSIGITENP